LFIDAGILFIKAGTVSCILFCAFLFHVHFKINVEIKIVYF